MSGIYNILSQRYNLQPRESVLVIYDDKKESIARGFMDISRRIGAHVTGLKLGKRRFEDRFDNILTTIKKGRYDLYINVFESKSEETRYRLALTKAESDAGGTIGHGPGLTQHMVSVKIDYADLSDKADRLRAILKGASRVRIETRLGMDLTVHIRGRKFHDDIQRRSRISNIPCGEIWCAPVETKGGGVLIADGSAGSIGLLPQPLRIGVDHGRITDMRWLNDPRRNATMLRKIRSILTIDDGASIFGEFGIGLAPFDLSGNLLQDEKAAGTIHIAFGDSFFYGGKNKSKTHFDLLVRNPTVTAFFAGGRRRTFMARGKLIF
jgi:leucyl aminopeptidase (aminopeptidase T)